MTKVALLCLISKNKITVFQTANSSIKTCSMIISSRLLQIKSLFLLRLDMMVISASPTQNLKILSWSLKIHFTFLLRSICRHFRFSVWLWRNCLSAEYLSHHPSDCFMDKRLVCWLKHHFHCSQWMCSILLISPHFQQL